MTVITKTPPKTQGETLDALLREKGLNQTEASTKLNLTRPYLNGVINGKYSLSADLRMKLQPILGVRPDFWNEVQTVYDAWRTSPEGRAIHMAKSQEDLYLMLDVRGQHTLLDHEIIAAINAGALNLLGFNATEEGRVEPTGVLLTLGEEGQIHVPNTDRTQTVSLKNGFTLKRGSMITLETHEHVNLPARIRALVNGAAGDWNSKFLQCFHERVRQPGSEGRLAFGLVNAGPQDVVLTQGDLSLSVSFEYLAQESQRRPSDD